MVNDQSQCQGTTLEQGNEKNGGCTNLNVNDPITLLTQVLASPQRVELVNRFDEGILIHPNQDHEYFPYQHQVRFHAHPNALVDAYNQSLQRT